MHPGESNAEQLWDVTTEHGNCVVRAASRQEAGAAMAELDDLTKRQVGKPLRYRRLNPPSDRVLYCWIYHDRAGL
jgi:hypothetical protein